MDGRTWCHKIVDLLLYNCHVFFLISLICRQLLLYCLFLCCSVRIVTLVVFASSFKIDEFLHKMAISFSDLKDEKQNQSFLANWTDCARSSHYLLWLEGSLSAHLTLGSTEPCGRPSASLEFLHSLIPPHYTCCISLCCSPRHNIRRRSLSMLVPRKKWTVPQLTGVYGMVRVPRNLDSTLLLSRSLLPWSKIVSRQPKLCI